MRKDTLASTSGSHTHIIRMHICNHAKIKWKYKRQSKHTQMEQKGIGVSNTVSKK